jgi:effector-binding domain-containing protein
MIYEIETRTLDEQDTAVVRRSMDANELTSWLSGVYGTLTLHLQRIGVATVGPPFVRYHGRDGHVDVEAGVPTAERITPKDEVKLSSLPAGTVATTWHRGSPDELDNAFEALEVWMARTGVEPVGAPWAVHHIDPTALPERDTWTTEVIQPFRE